jgi:pimeloyl-ACP methyl ester carboxylesterase
VCRIDLPRAALCSPARTNYNSGVHLKAGRLRGTFFVGAGLLAASFAAFGEHRLISLGDRRLSIDCDGEAGSATVVLIAGGGRTAKDWARVQPTVSKFARVCSYDRAGFGDSDKAASKMQSVDEVIDDLHLLLKASDEKRPFLLVGHSVAGIYARSFVTKFPREVAGLVFVDSAHEEQALRFHELDPNWQALDEQIAHLGLFVKPGERLEWRTELPVIVLGHGRAIQGAQNVTEEASASRERIWRELQKDLATHSTHGEFRIAEQSGHYIQLDQPGLVIQAIREVLQK